MTKSAALLGAFALLISTSAGNAQGCDANFTQEGVPLVTGITYRSSAIFPGLNTSVAFKNLHRAVVAEGYEEIRANASLGTISAVQETSGSGRDQILRISARKSGKGTHVTGTFAIQAGQVASADAVRRGLCRILDSAE